MSAIGWCGWSGMKKMELWKQQTGAAELWVEDEKVGEAIVELRAEDLWKLKMWMASDEEWGNDDVVLGESEEEW